MFELGIVFFIKVLGTVVSIVGILSLIQKRIFVFVLVPCTVNKRLAIFPFPAGMSLTKLSLALNHLVIPGQGDFGY